MQNALRPSIRHPEAVRVAVVRGRVRSCPCSLTALATIVPSRTISRIDAAKASARECRPAATAARQRRTMVSRNARCMLTPIVTDASPRARRLEATAMSWTDSAPSPPYSVGIGAVK